MNDLLFVLYNIALERDMETRFISDMSAYRDSKRMGDRAYERLLPLLDAAAQKELDIFLDERHTCESLERESLFAAGLSIGLALSRLG